MTTDKPTPSLLPCPTPAYLAEEARNMIELTKNDRQYICPVTVRWLLSNILPLIDCPTELRQAAVDKVDLSKCPRCKGPADNGHDRCYPPNPYNCKKCHLQIEDNFAYNEPSDKAALQPAAQKTEGAECCDVDLSETIWHDKYHTLCEQSWKALGISEYTGLSIPEHISALASRASETDMVPRSEYDAVCKDLERMHDALNEQANAPENTRASVDVEGPTPSSQKGGCDYVSFQEAQKIFAKYISCEMRDPNGLDETAKAMLSYNRMIAAKFPELVGGRE